jgi:CheY-like chemotaxis protein
VAKVLVVDDDKETRLILRELLKDEGFHVNVARNGLEALNILKHEGEWVVLLDVKMPHSGLQ